MIVYWIMMLLPAFFTLHPVRIEARFRKLAVWLVGIIFALIIGFRYEVGGDWERYFIVYRYLLESDSFFEVFLGRDIGFEFLYWLSFHLFSNIYFVNLICAIFFIAGLIRLCLSMPLPWLALLVSVPFLIVVVSMGYTRQAAAVGLFMWGLVSLMRERKLSFYLFVIFASLFHYTVLIMLPIGLVYGSKKVNVIKVVFFSVIIAIFTYIIFSNMINHMFYYYILIKFHHSDGALLRILVSFVSAVVFFINWEKFKEKFPDEKLWFIFSLVSIFLLPLSIFYSTFADRIAIYFLVLQLVVLSRVPILITSVYNRTVFVTAVVGAYSSMLFVWLIFGNHSNKWLPYVNILLQ